MVSETNIWNISSDGSLSASLYESKQLIILHGWFWLADVPSRAAQYIENLSSSQYQHVQYILQRTTINYIQCSIHSHIAYLYIWQIRWSLAAPDGLQPWRHWWLRFNQRVVSLSICQLRQCGFLSTKPCCCNGNNCCFFQCLHSQPNLWGLHCSQPKRKNSISICSVTAATGTGSSTPAATITTDIVLPWSAIVSVTATITPYYRSVLLFYC